MPSCSLCTGKWAGKAGEDVRGYAAPDVSGESRTLTPLHGCTRLCKGNKDTTQHRTPHLLKVVSALMSTSSASSSAVPMSSLEE